MSNAPLSWLNLSQLVLTNLIELTCAKNFLVVVIWVIIKSIRVWQVTRCRAIIQRIRKLCAAQPKAAWYRRPMSFPWTGKRTTWHSVRSSTMVIPASSWDDHLEIGVSESTLTDEKILYLLHTRLNLSYSERVRGRHLRSNHNTQTDVLISRLALQVPDNNVGNIWFEVSNHITSLLSFSKSPVVCSIYSPCFRSRQPTDHV